MLSELDQINLIKIGSINIQFIKIIYVLLIFFSTIIGLSILQKSIAKLKSFDEGKKYNFYTISKYIIWIAFLAVSLQVLGFNISVLLASSAALFVGIGLGLQGLFSDFFSGIILLSDGTVKVGNVIQLKDVRVQVMRINLRTSVLRTREGKEIIVPNSQLTKNEILNWSSQRSLNRHSVEIIVNPHDVVRAQELIMKIISKHPKVTTDPEPYVRIERFAEYGVEIKLLFWSEEVLAVGRMLGDVRLLILQGFLDTGLSIPYPQHVVTIKNKED